MAAMTANRQLRFSFFCKISFESTRCWSRDRNSGRFLRSFLSRRHTSSDASRSTSNFPSSMSATDTCSDGSVQSIMNIQNMLKNTVPLKTESKLLSSCVKVTQTSIATPMSTHSELQYDYGHRFEDYDKSRRAMNGGLTHKALLVDAAGTLLVPSQPAAKIYQLIGRKYGVTYSEEEILARYRWAYSQPWCRSRLRYVKDGRPFWQFIVEQASGCSNSQYFEELYQYYATAEAWQISDPEAGKVLKSIRDAGVKLAVVSNFDTRLRPLMHALECFQWFDALAVSAEVEAEKPNPTIFFRACELLGVNPEDAVHVGDDRRNDIWGARDAGCDAWLWGADVFSFREVAERIGVCVSSN